MSRLTKQKAKQRAEKGWETRRRKNPDLQNIHKVGKNQYEWRRRNETVPLENFTDKHIEVFAPGLAAVDKHLKNTQQLNAHLTGHEMRFSNAMGTKVGGMALNTADFKEGEVPGIIKSYHHRFHGVPKEDWSNRNVVNINLKALDHPNKDMHPTGIITHEIGHLVGPGKLTSKQRGGVGNKQIQEYGEAFNWRPPLKKPRKKVSEKNIDTNVSELPFMWSMEATHPASKSENQGRWWEGGKSQKGLSKNREMWYGGTNYHEDFAESFRNLVGIELSKNEKKKSSHFHWEDTKSRSREAYMRKYHLQSTERRK